MIAGLGIDLVDLARIRRVLTRHRQRFLQRCFHPEELGWLDERIDAAPGLAARFAAKEAFQKCWPASLGWKDVWVVKAGAKPSLRLSAALERAFAEGGFSVHLSLTHSDAYAAAVVVLERRHGP